MTPEKMKSPHKDYGGECGMAETVEELKKDVGTLKIGQIELKSQIDGFMQVFKIQFDSQNKIMEKLEESNAINTEHITQLKMSNENVSKECSIKEKELLLKLEEFKGETREANLTQDLRLKESQLAEKNKDFAHRLWFKIQDKAIELFIGASILGYMVFHGLK